MEAIVKYNYRAQEPDELNLKKGDVIKEIKAMSDGWWEGTLRDKRGMFHDNFVQVLEHASGKSGSGGNETISSGKSEDMTLTNGGSGKRWCKVLYNYDPCDQDELALALDDIIEYLGEDEEGWWRGRLRGKLGVFPSNFVTPPVYEEPEKKNRELCIVLFPYEAEKEDELTLVQGDTITLISRDAPDKGWWKGELRGQVGYFPDNFVEVIDVNYFDKAPEEQEQTKKSEKTTVKKNVDGWNAPTDSLSSLKLIKKTVPPSPTSPSSGSSTGERKTTAGNSLKSSLKRLVSDASTNNGNASTNPTVDEELNDVQRGVGAPLSHLTASRAKIPQRRPPSSQHLRRYAAGSTNALNPPSLSLPTVATDDNLANGSTEILEHLREEDEGLAAKARKKAPWVEELKQNQLERKKISSVDRTDKPEIKKERPFSRISTPPGAVDLGKSEAEVEESKPREKDKIQKPDTSPHLDQLSPGPEGPPAYIPYSLYSQLLDRVATLEKKQATLQQTVEHLCERVLPYLSVNNKE